MAAKGKGKGKNNKIVLHICFILAFRSYHWNAICIEK